MADESKTLDAVVEFIPSRLSMPIARGVFHDASQLRATTFHFWPLFTTALALPISALAQTDPRRELFS